MRKVTALVLAVVMSGCSLIKMQAPPSSYTPPAELTCDKGIGWPLLDTGLSALWFGSGGVAIAQGNGRTENTVAAVGLGVLGAVFVASAVKGFVGIGKCTQYEKERVEYVRTQDRAAYEVKKIQLLTPKSPIKVVMRNEHLEAIYTVRISYPDTNESEKPFSVRLAAQSEDRMMIQARPGQSIAFETTMLYLGVQHTMTPVAVKAEAEGTLVVVFDFDSALAEMRQRAGFVRLEPQQ